MDNNSKERSVLNWFMIETIRKRDEEAFKRYSPEDCKFPERKNIKKVNIDSADTTKNKP
jgi:hypothetical protein